MNTYNLYIGSAPNYNTQMVFAIPEKLAQHINNKNPEFLRLIGSLESNLTAGSYPIVTTDPSLGLEACKDLEGVQDMYKSLKKLCDPLSAERIMTSFLHGLKFEGAIHSLDYIGNEDPTGNNIQVGRDRGFYHAMFPNVSIKSQFFITERFLKIDRLREPYEVNQNFDVEVQNAGSMHCYRIKDSTNDQYIINNYAGKFSASRKDVTNMNLLKIVDIGELHDFLDRA